MLNKLGIYIPSRKRSQVVTKCTIANIPEELHNQTHVVVSETEKVDYEARVPESVQVLLTDRLGIADVRQWILEHAEHEYVMFISDDIEFAYRNDEGKLRKADNSQVMRMIKQLYRWLHGGYTHVGVSQRAFNHTSTEPYVKIARMNDVYAYNKNKTLESGARFDRLKVMEDFDITLSLLRLGHINIVTHEYAWSQKGSGASGGCAEYRGWQMQRDAAYQLAKLHPGCITVREKKSKSAWESVGKSRVDVIVHWKRAYKPKVEGKKSLTRFLNG